MLGLILVRHCRQHNTTAVKLTKSCNDPNHLPQQFKRGAAAISCCAFETSDPEGKKEAGEPRSSRFVAVPEENCKPHLTVSLHGASRRERT
jgi:hypothetical protein